MHTLKDKNEVTQRHMSLEDRVEIQECLSHGMNFKTIGKRIGKSPTTISREVKKRTEIVPTKVERKDANGNLVVVACPQLKKAPFVCNGCCSFKKPCAFDKHIYKAVAAQNEYKTTLRESREGIALSKEVFWENNAIISKCIRDGQHLYHILHANNLDISVPTAYRYFNKDYFSVSVMDLPRQVKFKQRRLKRQDYIPKGLKIGRTYNDFLAYKNEHDLATWWEMDTVIGRIGGKCILTFCFIPCNFMFGLLLDNKSAPETAEKIKGLKKIFRADGLKFGDYFPEILTDNGGEFADVASVEKDLDGSVETHLFFADPYRACQKPHVEKTHSCFRDIVPKGTSFDSFTQEHVNIIFSHVNAACRKGLHGKTAYDVFCAFHDRYTAELFGIMHVDAHAVVQNKKLLETLGLTPKS
jgi:IS30 family transposase